MEMKMKNRSHRYEINRPRSRHGHKYSKYKKCLCKMMPIMYLTTPKQHLKLNSWKSCAILGLSWEKNVAYKKACIPLNKAFGNIFFVCSTGVGEKGPKQRRAGAREAETNRITTRGQTHNHRQLMRHQESSKEFFFGVCLQYFYTFSSAGWSLISEHA